MDFFLILIALILSAFQVFRHAKTLGATAYLLVTAFYFIYYVFPYVLFLTLENPPLWAPVNGKSMKAAAELAALCQLTITLGYWISNLRKGSQHLKAPNLNERSIRVLVFGFAGLLLAVGISGKVLLFQRTGISPDLLLQLSPGYKKGTGVELSGIEQFAGSFLLAGTTIAAFGLLAFYRRWLMGLCAVFASVVIDFVTTGKRAAPLSILVIYVLWVCWFKQLGFKVSYFFSAGALIIVLIGATLVGRTVLPNMVVGAFHASAAADQISADPIEYFIRSGEFTLLDFTAYAIQEPSGLLLGEPRVDAMFRGNFEGLLYVIPRSIFPSKPDLFVDFSHNAYYISTGGYGAGIAVGWIGVWYTLGGFLGTLVIGFSIGVLCGMLDTWAEYNVRLGNAFTIFVYPLALATLVFPFLRYGAFSFVWIDLAQKYLGFFGLALLLWLSIHNPTSRAQNPRCR